MDLDALRRLKALFVKEFFQIIRDPSSIIISTAFPILLLLIYGFGVSLDLNHLRIGLVLEDTSPDAISFTKSLTNSRFLEVTIVRDRRELEGKLIQGLIRGYVVVPAYFSEFRFRPDVVAPIQVIADGSEPNTANFVQNYVSAAWQNWLQQEQISSDLQGQSLANLLPRFWYNQELESRNFLIPGSLAIIMTLIGTLLTSLVVSREWERGTMEAMMSTPVTIVELVVGKLIPYYLLGFVSLSLCVVFSLLLYDLPLRGSFFALAFVSGIFLIPALGVGLLVSTISKNQVIASQIALVVGFLPAFMLSGFIFEISSMPVWIQFITYLLPARYFVSSLLTIFLVGDIWSLILFNAIPMLIMGILLFLATARRTVKRLD